MKKNQEIFVIVLVSMFLSSSICPIKAQNNDQAISKTTAYVQAFKYGTPVDWKTISSVTLFDNNDNTISKTTYDDNGHISGVNKYIYRTGMLVEIKFYNATGNLQTREKLFYDSNNKHIRSEYYSSDSHGSEDLYKKKSYVYKYDGYIVHENIEIFHRRGSNTDTLKSIVKRKILTGERDKEKACYLISDWGYPSEKLEWKIIYEYEDKILKAATEYDGNNEPVYKYTYVHELIR